MAGDFEGETSAGRQFNHFITMGKTNNNLPLRATNGPGSISTTKAGVLGYILGLATAGILYLVTNGKGKRSNGSRSGRPIPDGEPTLLPPTERPVDVKGHDNDGSTAEEPVVNHHAPAGVAKRKLTDEEVALIRAWEEEGVSAKESASRLGISVKTVYARRKQQKSNEQNQKNNGSQE